LTIKPLYLLADSQLLFRQGDEGVPARIRADLIHSDPKAAYIGASNGDNPEFYGLFAAAMQIMGVPRFRLTPARPTKEDHTFLEEADLVVLAGGDVERGWHVLEQNGMKDLISRKRYEGCVFVGISAGAMQLGLGTLTQEPQPKIINMFRFAPFYVGAHAENDEWFDLRALVNLSQPGVRGIGLPAGGGAIYWPDGTLEPLRKPLIEFVRNEEQLSESLILPAHAVAEV
jgi:peptidase E